MHAQTGERLRLSVRDALAESPRSCEGAQSIVSARFLKLMEDERSASIQDLHAGPVVRRSSASRARAHDPQSLERTRPRGDRLKNRMFLETARRYRTRRHQLEDTGDLGGSPFPCQVNTSPVRRPGTAVSVSPLPAQFPRTLPAAPTSCASSGSPPPIANSCRP
jgi:hypothetical protein